MAMKKTHDAVYSEKYEKNGEEKTRYTNIGSLLAGDDGRLTLKLEAIPVGFNGWVNFYEPKPKDGEQPARQERPRRGGGGDNAPTDDIPF